VGAFIPIEQIKPSEFVLSHANRPHKVLQIICKPYRGAMIGIRHNQSSETLWVTVEHLVLAKPRPRSLGGNRDWSSAPLSHLKRRQQLRREMSPAERQLWCTLRNKKLGFKFRRQHPIGPYIADFYSREAHLVIEVDGSGHCTSDAIAYDTERDAFMHTLGLNVLRFTTTEVEQNLESICLAIQKKCLTLTESLEDAQWIKAGALEAGDLIFFGPEQNTVHIEVVKMDFCEEEVYDPEIEGDQSFITEVCVVKRHGSSNAGIRKRSGAKTLCIT
jgi:very-short-patch-repair endonuclease